MHHKVEMMSSLKRRRIKNLTANALKVQPAVNQVELNFWNPQPELLEVRHTSI